MASDTPESAQVAVPCPLPRVTIQFCTQCKWMLRAAYYAQELLSTFSISLGEVALQPSTGGTFVVTIHHNTAASSSTVATSVAATSTVLWDRKVDGGFPETKELKRRVRDVIQPGRDLGHVDKDYSKTSKAAEVAADKHQQSQKEEHPQSQPVESPAKPGPTTCEDCQ